jgi:hypothetical protein
MPPTVSEVESLSSKGWNSLDSTKKQELLDMAEREANELYSGQVSTLPEIEGDTDDFIRHLAAHKWTLAEGGEAQSESNTGGNVSYNTVTGENLDNLSQTRFGREAKSYLRDESSISVVTTY